MQITQLPEVQFYEVLSIWDESLYAEFQLNFCIQIYTYVQFGKLLRLESPRSIKICN